MARKLTFDFVVLATAFLVLLSGCSNPSRAPATVLNSSKKPKYKDDLKKELSQKAKVVAGSRSLPFVLANHFAIFSMDVADVRSSETFSNIDWDEVEVTIARTIGVESFAIEDLNRIWLAIDKQIIAMQPEKNAPLPFIVALDYAQDVDTSLFTNESSNLKVAEIVEVGENLAVTMPTNRQILIGSKASLENIGNESESNQRLVNQYSLQNEKSLTGYIDTAAISGQVRNQFGFILPYLGEYAKLVDTLKYLAVEMDIDAQDFVEVEIKIEDDELVKSIASQIESLNESEPPEYLESMMTGMVPEGMHKFRSMKAMFSVLSEVVSDRLLSVRTQPGQVSVKLRRANSLGQFAEEVLMDGMQATKLQLRLSQAEKIGKALEAYESKFGKLPPQGIVTTEQAGDSARAQFNWMVGILPELGKQDLYDEFDFAKSFDDPANMEVAKKIPDEFRLIPLDKSQHDSKTETRFKLIGGSGLWGDGKSQPATTEVTDERKSTGLIAETGSSQAWHAPESGIWMAEDIDETAAGMKDENGVIFINADFKPVIVKKTAKGLNAVVSAKGGENVSDSTFIKLEAPEMPK